MEFIERIQSLSDKELIDIIKSKDDYQEKFWELAVSDAENRGLSGDIKEIIKTLKEEKTQKEIEKNKKKEKKANLIELYSDRIIIVFSILFTTFAGSLLFANNLKRLKKPGGDITIVFGILYTIGIVILASVLNDKSVSSLSYLLNILGGLIITIYFGGKCYPKNIEYKKRKVWKPFIIAFLITIFIVFLIIYK